MQIRWLATGVLIASLFWSNVVCTADEERASTVKAGPLVAPLPVDEPEFVDSVPVEPVPVEINRLPVLAETQIPLKVARYARRYVQARDKNGDGVLQAEEWNSQLSKLAHVDADANGELTWLEIASRITRYGQTRALRPWTAGDSSTAAANQNRSVQMVGSSEETSLVPQRQTRFYVPSNRLSSNLPKWFVDRDRDGDGQLTLREFAPNDGVGVVRQFREYDRNQDGVIVPRELLQKSETSKKKEESTGNTE